MQTPEQMYNHLSRAPSFGIELVFCSRNLLQVVFVFPTCCNCGLLVKTKVMRKGIFLPSGSSLRFSPPLPRHSPARQCSILSASSLSAPGETLGKGLLGQVCVLQQSILLPWFLVNKGTFTPLASFSHCHSSQAYTLVNFYTSINSHVSLSSLSKKQVQMTMMQFCFKFFKRMKKCMLFVLSRAASRRGLSCAAENVSGQHGYRYQPAACILYIDASSRYKCKWDWDICSIYSRKGVLIEMTQRPSLSWLHFWWFLTFFVMLCLCGKIQVWGLVDLNI